MAVEAGRKPPGEDLEGRLLVDEEESSEDDRKQELPEINFVLTSAAVFLSTFAAGWMAVGIFPGLAPKSVALLGAAIGPGMVAYSYRTRRPSFVQYATLPVAIFLGALLILPAITGGSSSLPDLVSEAVQLGGVAQPPIPFDPGWRFIVVVFLAVLGAGSASLAIALNRPKLGVFIPVALLFAAALVQPEEGTLLTSGVALALFVASLGVAYGVELQREGATSGEFELRRLAGGGAIVAILGGVLILLSRLGFLFPEPNNDQQIPPTKPEVQQPQQDRVLFTVTSDRRGPWRFGVLDVYDGSAWLLPPFDSKRFVEIAATGSIPEALVAPGGETFTAKFVINDVAGHVLPNIANATDADHRGFALAFDPRTQMFRLPEQRAAQGMTYTVTSPRPPGGAELAAAPPAPAELEEFLAAPPPPNEVLTLLNEAPSTNNWDRLQFVRDRLYQSVIAAGTGDPVDVPPFRVAEMLNRAEATPFEITAAEALLARWAGIPSRMGYGFHSGDKENPSSEEFEVHPRHGSTWLEAYFDGYGWIPIVGVPPQAKSSTTASQEENPNIRPTEELALIVYVPIELTTVTALFVVVRYWLFVAAPVVAGLILAWIFFPGFVKMLRRLRRTRWASRHGIAARIVISYAEFRDAANDLNVSDPVATPLEYVQGVERDDEHHEFAWLVTRAIWGDLTRDPRPGDAETAEEMSRSMIKRLRGGQSFITRTIAFATRTSLRDPYTTEIPNLWPAWAVPGALRNRLRSMLGRLKLIGRTRRASTIAGLLAVVLLTAACSPQVAAKSSEAPQLPEVIVPEAIGDFHFQREEAVEARFDEAGEDSLVTEGKIFTIRSGPDILGYLEVASFKAGLTALRRDVREGVLRSISTGRFELERLGGEPIYTLRAGEQKFFLFFAEDGGHFQLLVAQQGFDDADRLFPAILAFQRGEEGGLGIDLPSAPVFDPLRGGEE